MRSGGYEDERWWETDESKAWQSGKSTAEGPKEQWREDRKWLRDNFPRIRALHREGRITSKQADDWERIAQIGDGEFGALLASWYPPGRQTQPALWNDETFINPNNPSSASAGTKPGLTAPGSALKRAWFIGCRLKPNGRQQPGAGLVVDSPAVIASIRPSATPLRRTFGAPRHWSVSRWRDGRAGGTGGHDRQCSFPSCCSPPCLTATQLQSVTGRRAYT
jgi:hypothetical protein